MLTTSAGDTMAKLQREENSENPTLPPSFMARSRPTPPTAVAATSVGKPIPELGRPTKLLVLPVASPIMSTGPIMDISPTAAGVIPADRLRPTTAMLVGGDHDQP